MAYFRPRKPPSDAPKADDIQFPGPVEVGQGIWDTVTAPLAGLFQGLVGKNLNWEQYIREKAKKNRGLAPGSYPGRGPVNWLGRLITGK